jgi:hypothetical protein
LVLLPAPESPVNHKVNPLILSLPFIYAISNLNSQKAN